MQQVEHLIIGAGVAGLTLEHFLASESVALIDPQPGAYKIGESLIPELFRHPELLALVPQLQKLPSFTTKYGTTFVANGEVAYFPVAKPEVGIAMHIGRDEMEGAMAEAWDSPISVASVESIDFDARIVRTTIGDFQVSGLIFDCSGPAMVVARLRDEIEELLPGYATWGYYDVVSERPEAFTEMIAARGWSLLRFDVRHRKTLAADDIDVREIAKTTCLTRVSDGIWTWQIPLFKGTRLSCGVVSRDAPVSEEQYREIAEANVAPHFEIARRPLDGASPFNKIHQRGGFARRALFPAGKEFVLLADAYGFSDPVYSIGAGLAVNQAIEVAELVNRTPWSKEICDAYSARCRRTMARARQAFEFWYSGEVLTDPVVASEIQNDFLRGGLFQSGITEHYGAALDLATLDSARDPFEVSWEAEDVGDEVHALLALGETGMLAGWELLAARHCAGGLQLRWAGHGLPELTMLVARDDSKAQPSFRRSGPLALSYMQLFDGPYPDSPLLGALFDLVVERIVGQEAAWKELAQDADS